MARTLASHVVGWDTQQRARVRPPQPPVNSALTSRERKPDMSVNTNTVDERLRGARAGLWRLAGPWWLMLITGIAWLIISWVVLLFVLYGAFDIINSIAAREISGTWWLGLVAGILLILLGFWASQQMFPARAALLLLWVGFFALFRGISEIVIAFELRSRQHA